MARFYSNENFPLPVVEALRSLGHDVLTVQENDKGNQSIADPDVLAFAISDDRAIITLNRADFIALHRDNSNHSGIVVCTVDNDFLGQAQRIHDQVEQFPSLSGQLIRVNRSG